MGYYDSVKDSVKDNDSDSKSKSSSSSGNNSGGGFDTLKQAASDEERQSPDGDDDTPIEVLEDGLEEKNRGTASSQGAGKSTKNSSGLENNKSISSSNLEDKLDKIIEQNARMIEVLESFGK